MNEETGADVNVKVAGQEIAIKNVKSLNTLATVAGLVVSICGFTIGWFIFEAHAKGTEKRDETLITVLKDLTTVQRVTNCLTATPEAQREAKLAQCERIAR